MNTYVRDNFSAGVPAIFTTKGDIAAASAAGVAERVGVGPNGSYLFANSAAAAGVVSSPVAHVKAVGSANDAANADTWKIANILGSETFDPASAWSGTNLFTAPHAGFFLAILTTYVYPPVLAQQNNYIQTGLYKNGSLYSVLYRSIREDALNDKKNMESVGMDLVYLNAGDTLSPAFYGHTYNEGGWISGDASWANLSIVAIPA